MRALVGRERRPPMTEPPTRKSSGSNRAQDIHRTPPHSVDAEQGVLGSMLISPGNTIAECVEKIDEEYFYVPAHRAIYTAMVDLWNAGQAIDLITFTQVLRDRKLLDLVGGAAFVTSLFGVVPTAANVGYYIDIVRDKYILRSIIAASTESVRRAYEEQDEVGNLLDEMESRIVAIRERNGSVDDLPAAVSVMTLAEREPDPSKTLLGNRFLGVGGGMIFIGPSGGGKSSASVQQDISWSLGRPAFGIHPSRPLRILGLNAENDDGDLSEMVRGVCDHLDLNAEEREAVRERVLYVSDCSHTGESFLRMVERLLKKYGPFDLVRIDVLLAYLGGDVLDVEVTSKFLRNGLNPILKKFGCAAIINHHTPKRS